jgi:hypothetical protein
MNKALSTQTFAPRAGLQLKYLQDLQENTFLISGEEFVSQDLNGLTVVCSIRNGELYLKSFVEHYRKLGVTHFVFLDNGSTDKTIEVCSGIPEGTLLQTSLPYKQYYHAMTQFLLEKFGQDRWCLVADVDELFDYPYSDFIPIWKFLRYLDAESFDAVYALMLDMFSDQPLLSIVSTPEDSLKEKYPFYDCSKIRTTDYFDSSKGLINPPVGFIKERVGGIRSQMFGLMNVSVSKFPLIRGGSAACLLTPHTVINARIADVTGVLYHYKFIGNFFDYVRRSVEEGNHWNNSYEYKRYMNALSANPYLNLKTETASLLTEDSLLADGLVDVSCKYSEFVVKK